MNRIVEYGTAVRLGRRTNKGVAGRDLTSLLVGSEGTLGVVTIRELGPDVCAVHQIVKHPLDPVTVFNPARA